jgi:RHS repeat-associated protein
VGNVVNVVDSMANKTTFVFDALNREVQEIDPLGNSLTMAYDKASRMTSTTDRDGRRRDFSFDNDSRKTGETWVASGSTTNLLTFTFDRNSNLLTGVDYHGMYTMGYDALDRMTAVQEPFGQILTNTFDAVGNRTALQDSLGGTTTSIYDVANRLTTREFGGSGQTPLRINMSYTVRNQLATETRYSDLAGTQTVGYSTLTYDAESRLINLDHQNGSGTNLANYTYGYDLADRLTTETLNGGTPITYSYDKTSQLINDSRTAYTYDLNGNRTMTGYQTGGNNELTNDGTWTYAYDKEGNQISKTKTATAEVWSFGYDNLNHMISAIDKNSSGTTLTYATYLYDVFGNRIEKDVWQTGGSTTTTRFACDHPVDRSGLGGGGNIWADLNGSNGLVTRYILGDRVDQLIARISSSGTAAWYLTDRLGSVRNITDNSGSVIDTITYDGFGNVTNETSASNGDRWKFTGREFDSETGLQFNRARYYNPKTGRWTSEDPVGFAVGDANLYRYVLNQSLFYTDPMGLAGKVYVFAFDGFGSILKIHNPLSEKQIIGEIVISAINSAMVKPVYSYYNWEGKQNAFQVIPTAEKDIEKTIDKIRTDKNECDSKIIVVGYSWGAATVTKVVKDVSTKKKYKFRLVYTIDPVKKARVLLPDFTKNYGAQKYASQWINWYQQTDTETLPILTVGKGVQGLPIDGALNNQISAPMFKMESQAVLRGGQKWADSFLKELGVSGTIPVADWAKALDPKHGHTAIILYPPMLKNLHNEVTIVAQEVAMGK